MYAWDDKRNARFILTLAFDVPFVFCRVPSRLGSLFFFFPA